MGAGAELHVSSAHAVTFGEINAASAVYFPTNATIPAVTYGHLYLTGSETIKTLSSGLTRVAGNLTIADGVVVTGTSAGSVIALGGDMSIDVSGSFLPAQPFALVFEKGSAQRLSVRSAEAVFHEIVVRTNSVVQVNGQAARTNLTLGSGNGGGLTVETGGKFLLNRNNLTITGKGSINSQNQTGQVAFSQSALTITSATDLPCNLYPVSGADTVRILVTNLTASGTLTLQRPLFVSREVHPVDGVVESNGFLSLVSTREMTARVLKSEGSGRINGSVVFQRFIPKGKQMRYLSFPVSDASVAALQQFVPVTGHFNGASTGSGLPEDPSLFVWDDVSSVWKAFPEASNEETFTSGKGYAVFMHDGAHDTRLQVSGPLHQGDFSYSVTGNEGNDPSRGWNLIGNPYASAVAWADQGWSRKGIGSAAYVLDGRYPGGRYLVWDGELGDREFQGVISQGQGFFVRATAAAPVLNITEDAKLDTASQVWRQKRVENYSGYMVVTMKQDALIDRTYLKFSADGNNDFEETDAVKRKNGYFSVSTLSTDSISLSINHLKESFCDRGVHLLVDAKRGQYTFLFEGSGLDDAEGIVNLVDLYADKKVDLKQGSEYKFEINNDPASVRPGRFRIEMPSGNLEDPKITVSEDALTSNVSSGNQWLLDGEDIEGATSETYMPQTSGAYSLRVTADGCTRVSEPVYVTVTVTGIFESAGRDVVFYPNPASDNIIVLVRRHHIGKLLYTITTSSGMQVNFGEWESETPAQPYEIDVKALPTGIYFLHIQADGWKYRGKLMVGGR